MPEHTCSICNYKDTDGLYHINDNKYLCYSCIHDVIEVANTALRKFINTYGAN